MEHEDDSTHARKVFKMEMNRRSLLGMILGSACSLLLPTKSISAGLKSLEIPVDANGIPIHCYVWNVPNINGRTCQRHIIPVDDLALIKANTELPYSGYRISQSPNRWASMPLYGESPVENPSLRVAGYIIDDRQVERISPSNPFRLKLLYHHDVEVCFIDGSADDSIAFYLAWQRCRQTPSQESELRKHLANGDGIAIGFRKSNLMSFVAINQAVMDCGVPCFETDKMTESENRCTRTYAHVS